MRALVLVGLGLSFSILLGSTSSWAQGAPPPAQYPYYPPPPGAYAQQPGAAPVKLRYQDGVAPPAGYHMEEHPRKGLVIGGAVTLGTAYFLSATIGLSSSNPDDRWLLMPVFGPFIDMGARGSHSCGPNSNAVDCNLFEPIIRFYLAMDGIVQTAGGVLLLSGFLFPKKEFVSDTYYGFVNHGPRLASWTVLPQVTPGSRLGLTLLGEIF
jgi:hypothetical protein